MECKENKNSFGVFAQEIELDEEDKEESKLCDNVDNKTKQESERKNDEVMENDKETEEIIVVEKYVSEIIIMQMKEDNEKKLIIKRFKKFM